MTAVSLQCKLKNHHPEWLNVSQVLRYPLPYGILPYPNLHTYLFTHLPNYLTVVYIPFIFLI